LQLFVEINTSCYRTNAVNCHSHAMSCICLSQDSRTTQVHWLLGIESSVLNHGAHEPESCTPCKLFTTHIISFNQLHVVVIIAALVWAIAPIQKQQNAESMLFIFSSERQLLVHHAQNIYRYKRTRGI